MLSSGSRQLKVVEAISLEGRPDLGVRARNNAERRRRIREAARKIFCKRGYADATTREICQEAGVGNGTLFRHAADKRELLLLIVNDDMDCLHVETSQTILAGKKRRPLRENVLDFYRVRYEYLAKYPEISRPYVKEVFNFMAVRPEDVGMEARRHLERRGEVVVELAKIIAAHASARTARSANPHLVARLIHAIYLSANRAWLESEALNAAQGLRRFSELFDLAAAGFQTEFK